MDPTKPNPELYGVPLAPEEFNGMPYRPLGRSGLRVSNVGIGLWKVGYPETGDGARVDEKTAWEIFDRAIELGATLWDTRLRLRTTDTRIFRSQSRCRRRVRFP